MQIGLFGKYPAKGDFVTRRVPAEVLQYWETWLEKVVGGAKHHLAGNWQHTYGSAPVWRFWIGDMVFGHALAGALMPSVDRVGRQFPLTLVLSGAGAAHPAPPLAGRGNEAWYTALDAALLSAKSEGFNGDPDALLAGLSMPAGATQAQADDRRNAFFAYGETGLPQLLRDVGDHDHQLAAAGRSYWWTAGNAHVGPAIIALNGMPDAAGFAAMLTGFGPPTADVPANPVSPPAPSAVAAASSAWGVEPSPEVNWGAPTSAMPQSDPWAQAAEPDTSEAVASPFETERGWAVPDTPVMADPVPAAPVAAFEPIEAIEEESPFSASGDLAPIPEPEPEPEPELSVASDALQAPEDEDPVTDTEPDAGMDASADGTIDEPDEGAAAEVADDAEQNAANGEIETDLSGTQADDAEVPESSVTTEPPEEDDVERAEDGENADDEGNAGSDGPDAVGLDDDAPAAQTADLDAEAEGDTGPETGPETDPETGPETDLTIETVAQTDISLPEPDDVSDLSDDATGSELSDGDDSPFASSAPVVPEGREKMGPRLRGLFSLRGRSDKGKD